MTPSPLPILARGHSIARSAGEARIPHFRGFPSNFLPPMMKTMLVCQTEGNTTAVCRHTVSLWRTIARNGSTALRHERMLMPITRTGA
jgi:hypothetical protein